VRRSFTDEGGRRNIQRHLGVVCYPVLSGALRSVEAGAVIVASPPSKHKGAALDALGHRKHALVEKPLAVDMQDALEIARRVERSSARLMVAQGYRFADGPKRVRELLEARGDRRATQPAGDVSQIPARSITFPRSTRSTRGLTRWSSAWACTIST
jgi:predicted dehydrogenase